jgi:hypothetical protein
MNAAEALTAASMRRIGKPLRARAGRFSRLK